VLLQPDSISCGATCARIVCAGLGVHQNPPPEAFALACGTNPKTGTTLANLRAGLRRLGVLAGTPRIAGIPGLESELAAGRWVILPLLVGARRTPDGPIVGGKHWIVADGLDHRTGHILASDPSRARVRVAAGTLGRWWAARGHDGIVVDADPALHPASRMPALDAAAAATLAP
jgi:hypothetical protein